MSSSDFSASTEAKANDNIIYDPNNSSLTKTIAEKAKKLKEEKWDEL